jgi:hypothetical protein
VAFSRCERTRDYALAMLIEKHSNACTVPMLLHELSRECLKRKFFSHYGRCGVHCPELSDLSLAQRQQNSISPARE